MTTFAIEELSVVGVYDAGVPNLERVVVRVLQPVDLGQYGLMIGIRGPNGTAFPLRDNLLWFGNGWVAKGDWLFIYTAPGEGRVTPLPNNEEKLYSVHWGKKQTIFQNQDLVPILFRMDGIQVPTDLPAISLGQQAGG